MELTHEALRKKFEKQFLTAVFNDPLINPTGEQARRLAELAGKAFNDVTAEPPTDAQPFSDDDARGRLAYLNTIHACRKWKPVQKDGYIRLFNEAQMNRDKAVDGWAPVTATGREFADRLNISRGVANDVLTKFETAGILKRIPHHIPMDRHGKPLEGRKFDKELGDWWDNGMEVRMRLAPYPSLPDLKDTTREKNDRINKKAEREATKQMREELDRLRQMTCPECGAAGKFTVRCDVCGALFDTQHPIEPEAHVCSESEQPCNKPIAEAPKAKPEPTEPPPPADLPWWDKDAHDRSDSEQPCDPQACNDYVPESPAGASPGLSSHDGPFLVSHLQNGGSFSGHRNGGSDSEQPCTEPPPPGGPQ